MQITRQKIIDLLRKQGQATVEELAQSVELTPMAVRHHLNVLQAEGLIEVAYTKRLHRPGRPIQVYCLTNQARKLYPQEYFRLTDLLVEEITDRLGKSGMADVFDSIANRILAEAPPATEGQPFETRLNEVVAFLRDRGFAAEWEIVDNHYVIYHLDCPYRQFSKQHREVCLLDEKIVSAMLQVKPSRNSCIACDDDRCAYILTDVADSQPMKLVTSN